MKHPTTVACAALIASLLSTEAASAQVAVGERSPPEETWPVDVYVEARLVDGQPEWATRLAKKLEQAHKALQVRNHELDVACPVEIAVNQTTVYRIGEGGWVEGGGPITALRMPHDAPGLRPPRGGFETTRLYLAPGPGYAFGFRHENASYAWVGKWAKKSPRGRGGDYTGLLDPWGRCCGWVIIHELGHVAGGQHRIVRREDECSFMSYGDAMFPGEKPKELCPLLGIRMLSHQCAQWRETARRATVTPPDPADADRNGVVDLEDVARVRAILDGTSVPDPPPCLGFTSTGRCQLFPPGDANRDLKVDARDIDALRERLP